MGIWPLVSSGYGKQMYARVATMDADLDRIPVESDWTGRELFDTVCRIIGLREIWYFGLQYTNKKTIPCWLQMDKKISKQDVSKSEEGTLQFLFLVKFFPEEAEDELIQDLTRHLFFLQLKESILSGDLHCQPEAAVLLASFALQAMYGDCNDEFEPELEHFLPKSVISQFDLSNDLWWERLRKWWSNNPGMASEEAEMEYLRVAQDLDMYGIQYYPIWNKRNTKMLLGISAMGVGVYEGNNKLNPRPFFSWNEIKKIHFKNKKFSLKTKDHLDISFEALDASINMSILDLCVGTHNLYLRRRQEELLEVQQMKAQAVHLRLKRKEENERRLMEREERDTLKRELADKQIQLVDAQMRILRTEDKLKNLEDSAAHSGHQTAYLSKRANDAEAECMRLKQSQRQLEEAMRSEVDLYSHLRNSSNENRPHYTSHLILNEPTGWNNNRSLLTATVSYHQLMRSEEDDSVDEFKCGQSLGNRPLLSPQIQHAISIQPPPDPVAQSIAPTDLHLIKANLESTRMHYNERSKSLKDRLAEFRVQIEGLKRDDYVPSENDIAHEQNVQNGCMDRLTTLRMSLRGTTRSRIHEMDAK
ncbi:hypothetical protein PFISCL1PPCAC_10610 [Pristionchus fissidentatus]|uniref:Moesin/ezrin/radixin homolog 1 n=1 Tax=Pristionchus fissidentatus TaxID=1538716 RepID=A0AAV5VM23_9BILA|nr:hypothetical protein PFISCL1PPCAC_10610 [Pristionchus fissidentatus]